MVPYEIRQHRHRKEILMCDASGYCEEDEMISEEELAAELAAQAEESE